MCQTLVVGVDQCKDDNDNHIIDNDSGYPQNNFSNVLSQFMYFQNKINSTFQKHVILKCLLYIFPMLTLCSSVRMNDCDANNNNKNDKQNMYMNSYYARIKLNGKSLSTYIQQYKCLITVCVQLISFSIILFSLWNDKIS